MADYIVTPQGAVPNDNPPVVDTSSDASIESMLDSVPWADVPNSTTIPAQLYDFEIVDVFGSAWNDKDNAEGKAYVGIAMQILSPADFQGRQHTENLTIGTESDPKATRIETWLTGGSIGAVNLKRMITFFGLSNWRQLKGQRFAAFTTNTKSGDREYTNLQHGQYYHIGEVIPGTPSTVSRNRGRANATTKTNGVSSAPLPSGPIPCIICGLELDPADIIEHVKNCKSLATS